jgi:hypothetical protein
MPDTVSPVISVMEIKKSEEKRASLPLVSI